MLASSARFQAVSVGFPEGGGRKSFYTLTHSFTFQSYLQPFTLVLATVKN